MIKQSMQKFIDVAKVMACSRTFQSAVAALVSAGLLSWLQIRPLGLIFLTIFCYWFYRIHCNFQIYLPLENQLHTLPEFLIKFRKTHPEMFYILGATFFLTVALMGDFIAEAIYLLACSACVALIYFMYSNIVVKKDYPTVSIEDDFDTDFYPEDNERLFEKASDLEIRDSDQEMSDEVPDELLIQDLQEYSSSDDGSDDLIPIPVSKPTEHHQSMWYEDSNTKKDIDVIECSDDSSEFEIIEDEDFK